MRPSATGWRARRFLGWLALACAVPACAQGVPEADNRVPADTGILPVPAGFARAQPALDEAGRGQPGATHAPPAAAALPAPAIKPSALGGAAPAKNTPNASARDAVDSAVNSSDGRDRP